MAELRSVPDNNAKPSGLINIAGSKRDMDSFVEKA